METKDCAFELESSMPCPMLVQQCNRQEESGSCTHCVVCEGAPYGRIGASNESTITYIESFFHVTNHHLLFACGTRTLADLPSP